MLLFIKLYTMLEIINNIMHTLMGCKSSMKMCNRKNHLGLNGPGLNPLKVCSTIIMSYRQLPLGQIVNLRIIIRTMLVLLHIPPF